MRRGQRASHAAAALAAVAALLAGCGQQPVKPAETHIRADEPRAAGTIPPPVQITPVLPQPKPTARPETYSVVVNNVRVQELLFALARDARLNVDIHNDITGTVTLNAIDQTLPQLLTRIARQVDMRWEIESQNLVVMRDTPFLRVYRIDYVNLARDARSVANVSTSVTSSGPGAASSSSQNNSTSVINSVSANKFWDTLVANVKEILQETDKVLPAGAAQSAVSAAPSTTAPAQPGGAPVPSLQPVAAASFREAASVIANPEGGILNIRATSRQHEKVQEFLDQVMTNAKRQVLIEATVAEVQLNNEYQRGIDWQRLRSNATNVGVPSFGTGSSGLEFRQSSANTPASIATNAFIFGGAITSLNFNFAIKLLESFGDVRVLSSPKISVLNNQTAVMRVTRNLVYFTVTPATAIVSAGGGTVTPPATFTTTPNTVPEGMILTVVPQISDSESVVLNVRPTITRKVRDVPDPNPGLGTIPNLIPEMQTQEFESVMRLQSGQVAVLGGLMQDTRNSVEDTIPGVNQIPGLGELLAHRRDVNQKTELVIFLRPVVVRDASVDGDYAAFRGALPGGDFFSKPNPNRPPRAQGPFD